MKFRSGYIVIAVAAFAVLAVVGFLADAQTFADWSSSGARWLNAHPGWVAIMALVIAAVAVAIAYRFWEFEARLAQARTDLAALVASSEIETRRAANERLGEHEAVLRGLVEHLSLRRAIDGIDLMLPELRGFEGRIRSKAALVHAAEDGQAANGAPAHSVEMDMDQIVAELHGEIDGLAQRFNLDLGRGTAGPQRFDVRANEASQRIAVVVAKLAALKGQLARDSLPTL